MSPGLIQRLHQTVKQEAPWAYSAGWMPGFDLYLQARQHRLQHYTLPTQPYVVSEYGDWEYYAQDAGFAQHQWQGLKPEARTSRQLLSAGETRLLQQATNLQEAHNDNLRTPAFADGYWVMFDYNRGYANDLEASGIMSIYRQPKYSYYLFQSQRPASEQSSAYPSGPMVFIASDWTGEGVMAGQAAKVRVFSNAEQVALYLNGKLIDTRKAQRDRSENSMSDRIAKPPFEFSLPAFAAGTLEAKALIDGNVVATHQVHTPGPAAAIQIQLDDTGPAPAAFDEVFIKAQLVDGKGNPVRTSGVALNVQSSGLDLVTPQPVLTERGVAVVLVKTGAAGLKGRLTITAAGLPAATIVF
jgi:beta-galactosidase